MPMSQQQINITTPANVQATSYVVQINGTNYTYAPAAPPAPGAALAIPFSGLVPAFVPVVGTEYTVDVEGVDSAGTSQPSGSASWTQAPPIPNAPVLVSVT
jgi:hypothetical protein